jgi:anti-repressor protein
MWFLTENGVLELLTKSRKLKAKQLKLTIEEVLKDIREKKITEKVAVSKDFLSMIFDGKDVRMTVIDGELWTVLNDVCEIMEISNPRMVAERLADDEKGVSQTDTNKGSQNIIIINESGLYNVIFRSDKPVAREFRRWVTHEILPEIRKRGYYMTNAKSMDVINNPDAFVKELEEKNERLIADLEAERAENKHLLEEKKQLAFENEHLQWQAEKNRPKVTFANAVGKASCGSVLTGDLAKMATQAGYCKMGAIRINVWFKEAGWLIKSLRRSDRGRPTQRAIESGFFELVVSVVKGKTKWTPYVTIEGQQYFLEKFRKMHEKGLM